MKKNDGQVLIIVLLVLTLTMIFVITLFPLIIQSAKQASLSEQKMQTKHAAEMGMTLFEKLFDQIIDKKEFHSADELQNEVQNSTPANPVSLNDHVAYQLNVQTAAVTKNNDSIITITVDSYGLYDGKQKKDLQKTYTVTMGSVDGSGSNQIFTNLSDFDVLKNPSFLNFGDEKFEDFYDNINSRTHYEGSFNFISYNELNQSVDVSRYAKFQNTLRMNPNSALQIQKSTLFNNYVSLTKSNLFIGNDVYFQNYLDLSSQSNLTVGGNASFKGFHADQSSLWFGSNVYSSNDIQLTNHSNMVANGSMFIPTANIDQSTLQVKGHFFANNNIQLHNNAKMDIDGNASLSTITIDSSSTLTVKGNLTANNWLTINGKACVYGKADNIRTNATILHASSCDNQPNGTVFVLNQPVAPPSGGSGDNKNITVEEGDVIYK
ncbi:hypothetical protein [Bacillus smithii]